MNLESLSLCKEATGGKDGKTKLATVHVLNKRKESREHTSILWSEEFFDKLASLVPKSPDSLRQITI